MSKCWARLYCAQRCGTVTHHMLSLQKVEANYYCTTCCDILCGPLLDLHHPSAIHSLSDNCSVKTSLATTLLLPKSSVESPPVFFSGRGEKHHNVMLNSLRAKHTAWIQTPLVSLMKTHIVVNNCVLLLSFQIDNWVKKHSHNTKLNKVFVIN